MNNNNLEYLLECIENDKEYIINKIDNIELLKELYQTYLEYYGFYQNEFDSFNAKLSNLSTLVTVLLGFLITIGIFIFENEYLKLPCICSIMGLVFFILTFAILIILLCLICKGQSFQKSFTINAKFPIKTMEEVNNNSDIKTFYHKMIFCLYKIIRTGLENLDNSKKYFPHAFTVYIICVIISLISLVLICKGSI